MLAFVQRRDLPLVSLIVPIYDVEQYLPRFLSSLDAQTYPHERIEVLLALDGAVDGSPDVALRWTEGTDLRAQVLELTNGGQGRARNVGLQHVHGDWVGFPDPDDELGETFIASLIAARRQQAGMLIARTLIRSRGGTVPHPLDFRFAHGIAEVDVNRSPDVAQLSVHDVLVRGDIAVRCTFPEDRDSPTFEDAMFVGRVRSQNRKCVLVPYATYWYEKRASGDSAVQTAWSKPGRYIEQFEDRYIPYLAEAKGAAWAQQTVLYDLGWYFVAADSHEYSRYTAGLEARHLTLMRQLAQSLDPEMIIESPWPHLSPAARARLMLMRGEDPVYLLAYGEPDQVYRVERFDASRPVEYLGEVVGWQASSRGASANDARWFVTHVPRQPRVTP